MPVSYELRSYILGVHVPITVQLYEQQAGSPTNLLLVITCCRRTTGRVMLVLNRASCKRSQKVTNKRTINVTHKQCHK